MNAEPLDLFSAVECTTIPTIADAFTADTSTNYLSVIRFTCNYGYLIGDALSDHWFELQCSDSSDWVLFDSPVTSLTQTPTECEREYSCVFRV